MNNEWLNQNLMFILFVLSFVTVVSLILAVYAVSKYNSLKQRYEFFMGANRKRADHNMEAMLKEYLNTVREVEKDVEEVRQDMIKLIANMDNCVQKVGIVRYNPYEEMGGNLCYAVALLDGNDNGVVLNGIYGKTGCFTYAKPIEAGTSTYVLSAEEIEALDRAEDSAFGKDKEED
ncbi:MAG: DUF4446 family protein [Lachnospiraceae bacterium]|nr:DUF4446 family protein [Lachnospiraceae bacterium]